MFYYLEGTVALMGGGFAVIDCNGIGFNVFTTDYSLSSLQMGQKAKLYTYPIIREDCFDIYGFFSLEEKRCFEMLIGVSGVGPKAAQAILSCNTPEGLAMAILGGNDKAISAAPGVGKKIAQRVILELKDKISGDCGNIIMPRASGSSMVTADSKNSKLADATAALLVLGYGGNEISVALKGVDITNLAVEDIVRAALHNLMK